MIKLERRGQYSPVYNNLHYGRPSIIPKFYCPYPNEKTWVQFQWTGNEDLSAVESSVSEENSELTDKAVTLVSPVLVLERIQND